MGRRRRCQNIVQTKNKVTLTSSWSWVRLWQYGRKMFEIVSHLIWVLFNINHYNFKPIFKFSKLITSLGSRAQCAWLGLIGNPCTCCEMSKCKVICSPWCNYCDRKWLAGNIREMEQKYFSSGISGWWTGHRILQGVQGAVTNLQVKQH